MHRVLAVLCLIAVVAPVHSLRSQIVIVTARDAQSGRPIGDAEVTFSSTVDSVLVRERTGRDGTVRIAIPAPAGTPSSSRESIELRILTRAIGFLPATAAVKLGLGDRTRIDVILSRVATTLSEVRVTESRPAGFWLREFEEHRAHENGFFLDQDEIAKRGATRMTDLLRGAPGLLIIPFNGTYVISTEHAAPSLTGDVCRVRYFLDGQPFTIDENVGIDAELTTREIAAVEVYAGGARVPLRFNRSDARCGVIIFWSKSES